MSFNGATSGVVTPNIALGNTFSISAWVNPGVQSQWARIAETQYSPGFYLGVNGSGAQYKLMFNGGSGATGTCGLAYGCAEGGAVTGGWHLVTATFDGTTGRLYVDNALVGSDTFSAPPSTNLPLYIGHYYAANQNVWNGGIDEVRLYNRALTSAEVFAIFAPGQTSSVQISSLVCPVNLGANTSGACTVTLTGAAPAGGAGVTLSNTNAVLTVPASVTIAAGLTSATFNATTTAIASDQSATVTATYSASSANATVGLVASIRVSSLACPANLGPNASGTCTVTLTKAAPAGGAAVTITNTNTVLTVPASVTVAAGLTSATFNATTTAIASDQSAAVTATYNARSANATVGLVASVLVSSLACPANLGPNASGTCTVTLTKAAPAGGAAVTLTNTNTVLTVPASVTVAGGLDRPRDIYNATTTAIASDQSAAVTATYNASSANATVGLVAPVLVSALACNPTSLGSGAGTTCGVTLSKVAPAGGVVVALSSNNALLTTPTLVTVLAGSTTATFTATSGTLTVGQTASVTASYNGSSQSVSISLVPAVQVTSLVCNLTGLMPAGTTTCTVTLPQTVAANTPVSLSSSSPLINVPASVTVPSGSNSAGFNATAAGTIAADTSGVITATLGTTSKTFTLALWSTPTLVSLTCNPTALTVGISGTCTVNLSKSAGAMTVGISSSNVALSAPASVIVPLGAGLGLASFTVTATSVPAGWIILTASWNGAGKSAILTISASNSAHSVTATAQATSISCTPKTLPAGGSRICQVGLTGVEESSTAELQLSSSSDSV